MLAFVRLYIWKTKRVVTSYEHEQSACRHSRRFLASVSGFLVVFLVLTVTSVWAQEQENVYIGQGSDIDSGPHTVPSSLTIHIPPTSNPPYRLCTSRHANWGCLKLDQGDCRWSTYLCWTLASHEGQRQTSPGTTSRRQRI